MTWIVRGAVALLMILTLSWKLMAPPAEESVADTPAGLARILDGHPESKITSLPAEGGTKAGKTYGVLVAGCRTPLMVMASYPTMTATKRLREFQRPGDRALFAYFDWLSERTDRWTLLRLRLQNEAAAMVGLNRYSSSNVLLFIGEPSDCDVARTIPWNRFWSR